MSRDTFSAAAMQWHERYLRKLDERAAQSLPTVAAATRRLRGAHVSLIVDAGMAAPALSAFERLGLGRLSVVPMDGAASAKLAREPAMREGRLAMPKSNFEQKSFTLRCFDVDLVAVALSRPHPRWLSELNSVVVRHDLPLAIAILEGASVSLGPTVLPGCSSCVACTDVRLAANVEHIEAWTTERMFYDRNPGFVPVGRFDSLARVAGSLLGLEVSALLGGERAPHAVNRLVTYDVAVTPKTHRFVPYYEWCPVCREPTSPESCSPGFDAFMQRRNALATGDAR